MSKKKKKKWTEMTADELAEATSHFDKEDVDPKRGKVTPAEKKRHAHFRSRVAEANAADRKRAGRPRLGGDELATRVLITIDPQLLRDADRYADVRNVTRSQLISDALRRLLAMPSKRAG